MDAAPEATVEVAHARDAQAGEMLTRRAVSVRPSSVDEDARTVDLVWSTGAAVERYGFLPDGSVGRFIEELSLDRRHVDLSRLNAGAPLLDSHDSWDLRSVVGVVERASVDGARGVCTVRFSDREDVEPIWRDVKAGILRNVSVGYQVSRWEDVTGERDKTKRLRAVRWQPMEVSLVAIPADAGAHVRAAGETRTTLPHEAAAPARSTESEMADHATPSAAESAAVETHETRAAPAAVDHTAAIAAERERVAEITALARDHGLGGEFMDQHIRAGTGLDEARRLALAALVKRDREEAPEIRNAVRAEVVEDGRDKWLRGAEQWLFQKAGVGKIVVDAAKARGESVQLDAGEFRGLRMEDLARESLERSGVRTRGMGRLDMIGAALTHRSITQSTSDFAVLLENAMHKTLLAAYATQPDTWSRFCATGSVSDFRAHNRYRLGTFGRLDAVTETGEFKNKSIPDGTKEQISASTFGNIINLSRQAIINDDMGAFSRLATALGRAARLSIEVDVYGLLTSNAGVGPTMSDGKALFHADHGNLAAAAAPSVASIDAARQLMASQKDRSGNEYLDIRPAVWVGPLSLGGSARVINGAQYDPDTANKLQRPNMVAGLYSDIVDTPRLTGTAWYSFADPAIAPALEVAFLDGQSEPFLATEDGWRVDGVEWKVRLDYGVAAVDYVGVVRNPGA